MNGHRTFVINICFLTYRFKVGAKSSVWIPDITATHDPLPGNQSGDNDKNRGRGHHWSSVAESMLLKVRSLHVCMNVNSWIIVLKKSFNETKKNAYCKYEWKDVKRYYHMSIEKLFSLRKAVVF